MKVNVCVQKHVSVEYTGICLFFYCGNKHQYYKYSILSFFLDLNTVYKMCHFENLKKKKTKLFS